MSPPAPVLDSLRLTDLHVVGGESTGGSVVLTGPAPGGGVAVALACDSDRVTCPPSVQVPAGATAGGFGLATEVVAADTTVAVTASYGGVSRTEKLDLLPAVSVERLSIEPGTVRGGEPAQATVTLSGPAPAGGVTLILESTIPSIVPPASAAIAEGEKSASFTVETTPVGSERHGAIFASYGDLGARGTLAVEAPRAVSLSIEPASIVGGNPATATVTLDGAAAPDGPVLAPGTSDASVTVPATVVVPPGSTSTTFTVATTGVAAQHPVTLHAGDATATLTLEPAALASVTVTPPQASSSFSGSVSLTGFAPPGCAAVALSAPDGFLTPAPATVTVPEQQSSASIAGTAQPVTALTPVRLRATYLGVSQDASFTLGPPLVSVALSQATVVTGSGPVSGPGFTPDGHPLIVLVMTFAGSFAATVTLAGPAPDGGTTVGLSFSIGAVDSSNVPFGPGDLPAEVVVPAGSTSGQAQITLGPYAHFFLCTLSISATFQASMATGTVAEMGCVPTWPWPGTSS